MGATRLGGSKPAPWRLSPDSYLADSGLEDSIEAPFGSIPVPGHPLFPHFLVETVDSVRERQQMAEPEGGDAVWE